MNFFDDAANWDERPHHTAIEDDILFDLPPQHEDALEKDMDLEKEMMLHHTSVNPVDPGLDQLKEHFHDQNTNHVSHHNQNLLQQHIGAHQNAAQHHSATHFHPTVAHMTQQQTQRRGSAHLASSVPHEVDANIGSVVGSHPDGVLYYSPALSFHNTPMLSPQAMPPQRSIEGEPGMPIGVTAADFGMYYANSMRRRHSGKVSKASPSLRWRNDVGPDPGQEMASNDVDDFRLEDPALSLEMASEMPHGLSADLTHGDLTNGDLHQMSILPSPAVAMQPLPMPAQALPVQAPSQSVSRSHGQSQRRPSQHQQAMAASMMPKQPLNEEIEERLRNAIAATSRANSRTSSMASNSSRRASASSQRTTPRIRPKIRDPSASTSSVPNHGVPGHNMAPATHSAEPSPLMRPYDTPEEDLFLKSNYHNLMDGTHHHLGLASANQMATELRSKKNVHKVAEQERRNRMNLAIADLEREIGPVDDKTVASKAATVERATEHIRKLNEKIARLESQVGLVRSEGTSPSGISPAGESSTGVSPLTSGPGRVKLDSVGPEKSKKVKASRSPRLATSPESGSTTENSLENGHSPEKEQSLEAVQSAKDTRSPENPLSPRKSTNGETGAGDVPSMETPLSDIKTPGGEINGTQKHSEGNKVPIPEP